jgi:hypothetical protein
LFEVVSCPHYLGEIIVYLGLVILTGGAQVNAWLMLAWVVRGGGTCLHVCPSHISFTCTHTLALYPQGHIYYAFD